VQSLSISDGIKRKIEWNTLKIRWGPDPLVSNDEVYVRQPRTVQQALQEQYKQLPNALGEQCAGKTTIGYRYWKGNDTGAILIFDKQGTIAGIQIAVTLICTDGRTLSQLEHEGTGTGLFLQNGTNPIIDSIEIPLWEDDIGKTKWVKGGCFKTMGDYIFLSLICVFVHHDHFKFKGQLSGFGWDIVANLNFSRRTERVLTSAISSFLIPVPTCIPKLNDELGGFTTQHLYFNTDPANLEC
ncbi:unnamed protein product, partial [Rotaria sp. Silwood1]